MITFKILDDLKSIASQHITKNIITKKRYKTQNNKKIDTKPYTTKTKQLKNYKHFKKYRIINKKQNRNKI